LTLPQRSRWLLLTEFGASRHDNQIPPREAENKSSFGQPAKEV
jgi:hypothetical protein